MRNIQNKLILYWSKENTISELISQLPVFCNNFEFQVKEGFLPSIGIYYLNTYKYDINDFLSNNNNICFKFKTIDTKNSLKEQYLLITTCSLIIMRPIEEKSKNICLIYFVGDLFAVEYLQKYENCENISELKNYHCFKIIWNENTKQKYDNIFCLENEKDKNEINDLILARRDIINNNFRLIEKNENLDVEDYLLIISIKKKLIKNEPNEIIYDEINKCYRKIIEILSNYEDENIKKYLDELHIFIDDYEKKYFKK